MNLSKKIGLIVFIIIALSFITSRVIGNQRLDDIFKSLLVVSTLIYYVVSVKKIDYIYIVALCLSLTGDLIFFNKSNSDTLVFLGLCAYFLSIFSIVITASNKVYIDFKGKKYLNYSFIPLTILAFAYYLFRDNRLNIILVLYAISYTFLFCFAIYYYLKEQHKAALWLLYGSIFLMSCNVFAGLNRLQQENKYYYIISGISYTLALLFITNSLILNNPLTSIKQDQNT